MAGTALTTLSLGRLLTPVIADIYKEAKGKAREELSKWETSKDIKKIAETLIKIDNAKTIWAPEEDTSLDKFYYPSKIILNNSYITINSYNDLPEDNIVIEGIVGQGKSIFMRHLAASFIKAKPPAIIPVFIELRHITSKRTLTDLINIFLESINVKYSPETLFYLTSSGKISLILDGFDEIPNECVSDTLLELQTLQTCHPRMKIVVSSRPKSHIQNALGFKVISLAALSNADYYPFISKLIPSELRRQEILAAIEDCTPNIRGLITTPLMLTLVLIVYQTEHEIPSTLSGFFDRLFGVVFARHDRLKAGFNRQHYSCLSESKLKKLFDAFCFVLIQRGQGRTITQPEFNLAFDSAIEYNPDYKCENEDFKKDIVNVACLMIEEGLDKITFLHKSILDYHAAAFIKDLPDDLAQKFYGAAYMHMIRWQHVIEFLKSIDPYRYAKDYIVKNFPEGLNELQNIIDSKSDQPLLAYIEKITPNATMRIIDKNRKEYTSDEVELSGTTKPGAAQLPNAFFKLTRNISTNKLKEIINLSGSNSDTESPKLSTKAVIEVLGSEAIRQYLKEVEFSLRSEYEEAQSYVEKENRRSDRFIGILTWKRDNEL
ncbi:NACHT domain-containing protein [Pseudomonas viridiflava]|uniref:NACHT domain-containing protein n=1 Tax=Pseudomonas viridiflava TaxID=33069 RepID=UPI001FD6DDFE|nr:NACHT domain-containing protein [Pseudomonas viridiflava]MCJ8177383.1 NACHT domain-containing protein [Pseudomonas viridiflava]